MRLSIVTVVAIAVVGASGVCAGDEGPVVATRYGDVRGQVENGIHVFKGIPYGAPTGGRNRFMPPREPKAWTGIRPAMEYGDSCPQISADKRPMSEDCLVLNVWTPGVRDGKRRPVMVWFHGGGYSVFSGSSAVYDGVRLARKGDVVIVTLNHRLNLFGYLNLARLGGAKYADSGNVGQLDLVAALRWVRDNIEAFGGDPKSVTIFGESGGGGKVATVMAMPSAQGLFHRAILQSGFGLSALPQEATAKTTQALLDTVGVRSDEVDELQSMPAARLLEAFQKITGGSPFGVGPVVDGRSLPRHPFTPDAPAQVSAIPVLLGYNKTETTGLFPPAGAFDLTWDGLSSQLAKDLPSVDTAKVIAGFRKLRPDATPSDLYFVITTEAGMGLNAHTLATRKAAQGGAPVFLYRLEWETSFEGGRLRTPHALDLPLVFDNVDKYPQTSGPPASEAQRVADIMSAAWLAFARTGNPNSPGLPSWPAFDSSTRATMIFNVTSRAISDPLHTERHLLPSEPATPW